jgi:hypothetical protein
MIQDIFQRWIVTALFVLAAAECMFAIATGRRAWALVVGRLLQVIMSVAMAVMAWPWGTTLPTVGPLMFFILAAVWFVAIGRTDDGHKVVNGYHALEMLAMSWMYAVMNGNLLPGQGGGGCPAWIDAANWIWAIGFAIAALWWLYWYFAEPNAEPTKRWHRFFGAACQVMMAAGMAIAFGVIAQPG